MEILQRNAELIRIAADLVERDKARVPVVRGVLDTLGHRRAAQLLHAQRQIVTMIMESRTELINGVGQVGTPPGGRRQSMIKISNAFRQVRAVNLECNRHLGKRRPRIGNLRSQCRHPSHLGR